MHFTQKALVTVMMICSSIAIFVHTVDAAGLVPCGGSDESACTICDLTVGIDNIVTFIVGLTAITAVVIFVVAGIVYIVSVGNPGMTGMAKTAIKNTFIGVAIVLSAFVVIHFTLRTIAYNTTGSLSGVGGNAWSFDCGTTSVAP